MTERWAVFTDLDGTFIDFETYSSELSAPSLFRLVEAEIPVLFCSSKTRFEQQALMDSLGVSVPCIVENGSGLYLPTGIPDSLLRKGVPDSMISWGMSSEKIRLILRAISIEMGVDFGMYSDLEDSELMSLTELDQEGARRARRREFSETLTAALEPEQWDELNERLAAEGLRAVCGGRFYTVTSIECDKGKALLSAMAWLRERIPVSWKSMALGDSANDVDMLRVADVACVVQRPDGIWNDLPVADIDKIPGIGPAGWTLAVSKLLGRVS